MSLSYTVTLGSIPAGCMLVATFIGLGKKVEPSIAGALQHFAAGVLLCTIGTELLPEMVNATGWAENVATGIGFFLGVFVLILLGVAMPPMHDDDHTIATHERRDILEIPTPSTTQAEHAATIQKRLRQRQSLKTTAFQTPSHDTKSPVFKETTSLLRQDAATAKSKSFPTALVLAVAIDSALDGLLIGIASATGPSAGPMMSASLSVEMSFLGLTLATALYCQSARKSLFAAVFGPAVLVLGTILGGLLANRLRHSPVLFGGLLSFGTSALLFMVAEELLLEAHEDGEHLWWVDLQLYTGFFCSILAGKLVPSD